MQHDWINLKRVLACIAVCLAFAIMASVFIPTRSVATSPQPLVPAEPMPTPPHPIAEEHEHDPGHAMPSTDPHEGLKQIGTIEHRRFVVDIYATEAGPRYTIIDRTTGETLGQLMPAKRVERWFPELPIPEMEFDTPGQRQMMMVDPAAAHGPEY